jgi:hypothetical protein
VVDRLQFSQGGFMIGSGTLRRLQVLAAFLVLALLGGCGGGGGDDTSSLTCSDFRFQEDAQAALARGATQLDADNAGVACETLPHRPASVIAQGLYTGTVTGSRTSTAFQMLSLENGDIWALYGDQTGASFVVDGFIQGPTTRSGSNVTSSSIKDFGSNPAAAASVNGTLTSTSASGTLTSNGTAMTFSGTVASNSNYVYDTPASLAQIAGAWTLAALDGTSATVNISSGGGFTGNNAGCAIAGSITPRASGKNVFDVTVTSGAAPCREPGTTATGIAVSFLLPNSTTRELVVGGVNAGRTAGNAFFGVR